VLIIPSSRGSQLGGHLHAISEPVSSSYENSNSSSENSDANVSPSPSPPGVRTWLQKGIRHPKQYTDGTVRYGMLSSAGKPYTLT
jgi:hypothetical protein